MSTFTEKANRHRGRKAYMNGDGPGSKISAYAQKWAHAELRSGKSNGTPEMIPKNQSHPTSSERLALGDVLERELLDRLKARGVESLEASSEEVLRSSLTDFVEGTLRDHDVQREHVSDFGIDAIDTVSQYEIIEKLTWLARAVEGHYAERDVLDDVILMSPRMLRNAKLLIGGFIFRLVTGRFDPSYRTAFKAPILEHVEQLTPELRHRFQATLAAMKEEFEDSGTDWTPALERTLWESIMKNHKSSEHRERMALLDQLRNAMPLRGNWTMAVRSLEPEIV